MERWYLIAYDIRDEERLRCVHSCIKKEAVAFQKSVFLLHKEDQDLERLLDEVRRRADDLIDDIRLYPIRHPKDLWTAGRQAEMFQELYGGRKRRRDGQGTFKRKRTRSTRRRR